MECNAVIEIRCYPKPAAVALEDGAAYRQSHAETFGLGGVESLEELRQIGLANPDAGVPNLQHGRQTGVVALHEGTDGHHTSGGIDLTGCLRRIHQQVEEDLL